jgi:uncharacterized protein (TIGR04255 family)
MKEGKKLTETQKPMGYLCQTEDQRKIVQFRVNGFSYHWLKPYDTWENFRDAARGLWTSYVDTAKPMAVIRVSLRYINSLELPFPMSDFGTYLTMPPRLPAELPQGVSRFLTRVSIDRNGAAAVITQAFEGLTGTSNVKVLLDIATSKQASFMKEEEIWSALEDLHTFKNEIFFNSVTEEAVRLFE